jgi:regulatory protein
VRSARGREPPSARVVATRLLARRDYSRVELEQRLGAKGLPAPAIAATLDEFEKLGYLSDARYAEHLVAQRAGRLGKRAIARDLREKGIAPTAASEALSLLGGRDELADARALWQRRFGTAPIDERDKARQVRFLMARGYGVSVALKVVGRCAAPDRESGDESA